ASKTRSSRISTSTSERFRRKTKTSLRGTLETSTRIGGQVMDGLGQGLAAMAFWGFVAALIVASIWDGARKREAQHETLRRLIESGKPVDEEFMDRVLGRDKHPDRSLRIASIILMWAAPGVAVLALFLFLAEIGRASCRERV